MDKKIDFLSKTRTFLSDPKRLNSSVSIQTLYSVLCWSTFGSDYSLESSWVWCCKPGTPVFGEFPPFFSADPLKLCQVGWWALLHNYSIWPDWWSVIPSCKDTIHEGITFAHCYVSASAALCEVWCILHGIVTLESCQNTLLTIYT